MFKPQIITGIHSIKLVEACGKFYTTNIYIYIFFVYSLLFILVRSWITPVFMTVSAHITAGLKTRVQVDGIHQRQVNIQMELVCT